MGPRSLAERLAASRRFGAQARLAQLPPAAPLRPHNRWRTICLIAAIMLIGVMGTFSIRPLVESYLLREWKQQLADQDIRQDTSSQMATAAEQGAWGLRLLVAATSSTNENAHQSAVRKLRQLLEVWRHDSATDHSADVQLLVHLLVAEKEEYAPKQLFALQPLVERVTSWPVLAESVAMGQYLKESEQLVRLLVEAGPFPQQVELPLPAVAPPTIAGPVAEVAQRLPERAEQVPAVLPNLPTRALPAPASPIPTQVSPPVEFSPPIDSRPPLMLEMLPEKPGEIRRLEEPPVSSAPETSNSLPDRVRNESTQVRNEASAWSGETREVPRRWQEWSDWQVIRLLPDREEEAEAELRLRGFQARDLAIAKRAVDREPAVRLQLTQDLPRITGIDARRWLQQLTADSDQLVRESAEAILRTAYNGPVSRATTQRR